MLARTHSDRTAALEALGAEVLSHADMATIPTEELKRPVRFEPVLADAWQTRGRRHPGRADRPTTDDLPRVRPHHDHRSACARCCRTRNLTALPQPSLPMTVAVSDDPDTLRR